MLVENRNISKTSQPQQIATTRVAEIPVDKKTTSEGKRKTTDEKIKEAVLYLKKLLIKTDSNDIKRLSKLPFNEFIAETQKLILKSKGYDLEFMAPIYMSPLNKKIRAAYNPQANCICLNSNLEQKTGATLYAGLCHEYEHMCQNYQVYRTKGLGEEAVEKYAQIIAQKFVDNIYEKYKNVSEEELLAMKDTMTDDYPFVESYVKSQAEGEEEAKKWKPEAEKVMFNVFKEPIAQLRKNLIEKYGEIDAESKEGKHAKEYFETFVSEDNPVGIKRLTTLTEIEAYISTALNYYNYLLKKIF